MKAPPPAAPIAPAAERPTFAVIVAAYQAAGTIAAALDSVLAQTLAVDEIIVCDDGSTDELDRALSPYLNQITFLRQANAGVSAARNAAVRAASSDFVALLDPDDLYSLDRMRAIAELATARPDLDVITTDVLAEVDGRPVGRQSEQHPFPLDAGAQRAEILRHSYLSCPAIRRERLLAVGGFDETLRIGEDWDCWIKLVLDGCLVGLIDEPLYHYRLGHGSLGSDPAANHRADAHVLERLLGDTRLGPDERDVVARGIAVHRREALLIDARQKLLAGHTGARKAALRIVGGRGFSLRSRVKACLSALAPRLTRRLLKRRTMGSPAHSLDVAHR